MKLWKLLTSLGATAVLSALVLTTAQGAVKDTKHNMNNVFGTNTIQDNQVCLPCHAPHNQPDQTLSTLWNHVMPDKTAYTLWEGAEGLDETSRKCLSCHDGTVAIDSYGGYSFGNGDLTKGALTASTFAPHIGTKKLGASTSDILGNTSTAGFVVGNNQDLTHDHPVGVVYPVSKATDGTIIQDTTGANTGFNKPGSGFNSPSLWTKTGYTTTAGVVVSYVTATGAPGGTTSGGGFALEGGNIAGVGVVGCGTCHTPHSGSANFMSLNNYGSQLCSTCHTR